MLWPLHGFRRPVSQVFMFSHLWGWVKNILWLSLVKDIQNWSGQLPNTDTYISNLSHIWYTRYIFLYRTHYHILILMIMMITARVGMVWHGMGHRYTNIISILKIFKSPFTIKHSMHGRHNSPQNPPPGCGQRGPSPPSAWWWGSPPDARWPGCPPHCPQTTGQRWPCSPDWAQRYDVPNKQKIVQLLLFFTKHTDPSSEENCLLKSPYLFISTLDSPWYQVMDFCSKGARRGSI